MFNLIILADDVSTHDTLLEALWAMKRVEDVCNIEEKYDTGDPNCQWEKWQVKSSDGEYFWDYKTPKGGTMNELEFAGYLLGMQEEENELMDSIKTLAYE